MNPACEPNSEILRGVKLGNAEYNSFENVLLLSHKNFYSIEEVVNTNHSKGKGYNESILSICSGLGSFA